MIHFPIRHKFCCVNLIGRNWRTWKLNRLTPICLLCAKMYLVALGVWSGFGKPWDSDYYISHSKSMDILDLLQSVLKQRYSKTHCGHRGPSSTGSRKATPVLSILLQRNKLFNHIDDGMHWVWLRWVPWTVTCSEACSHGLLSFIISLHMLMNGVQLLINLQVAITS